MYINWQRGNIGPAMLILEATLQVYHLVKKYREKVT